MLNLAVVQPKMVCNFQKVDLNFENLTDGTKHRLILSVIGCTVATDKASEVTGSLMSKTNIPAQTNK